MLEFWENVLIPEAEKICERVVNEVIRVVRSKKREDGVMFSESDSGLDNLWDEICVQVQGEESVFYEMQMDYVFGVLENVLKKYTDYEVDLLWLLTEEYIDWPGNTSDEDECRDCFDKDGKPITGMFQADCEYILSKLESRAMNYSNRRIKEYLWG